MTDTCPRCGYALKQPAWRKAYGWHQRHMASMNSTAVVPWQPGGDAPRFTDAERRQPVRAQNLESDFLTPLSQAVATAAFVSIGGLYAAYKFTGFTWDYGLAVGLVAGAGYWIGAMLVNRKLLWMVEKITNTDLDGDNQVGEPDPESPIELNVTHADETGRFKQMFMFTLPAGVTDKSFCDFAGGVTLEHRGLSEAAWTGHGRTFSKAEYSTLLDSLTRSGIIRWKNERHPAQGRELTGAGRRSLLQFVYTARAHAHANPPQAILRDGDTGEAAQVY